MSIISILSCRVRHCCFCLCALLQDIDQLVCIKGMVVRCSAIIPDLKRAFFRCFVCAHCVESTIDRGRIEEPKSCPQCQTLAAMEIIHNR